MERHLKRTLQWMGAFVCSFLFAMPLAAATTTVQTAAGETYITSNTACDAGIAGPNPWQTTYSHTHLDSVTIPMETSWIDNIRGSSSPLFDSWFKITAFYYPSTTYTLAGPHTTDGDDSGSGSFSHVVSGVRDGTSIVVTYEVWVHRQSDSPGVNLCYTSVQKTYSFT